MELLLPDRLACRYVMLVLRVLVACISQVCRPASLACTAEGHTRQCHNPYKHTSPHGETIGVDRDQGDEGGMWHPTKALVPPLKRGAETRLRHDYADVQACSYWSARDTILRQHGEYPAATYHCGLYKAISIPRSIGCCGSDEPLSIAPMPRGRFASRVYGGLSGCRSRGRIRKRSVRPAEMQEKLVRLSNAGRRGAGLKLPIRL